MEVFDANVAAVGLLQACDQVDQAHLAAVEVMADVEERLEVGLGEAELAQPKAGRRRRRTLQRVEMGLDVADGAVVVDEAVDLRLLEAVDQRGGRGSGAGENRNLSAEAKGEALKKRPPCRVDGLRVLDPTAVVLLNQVSIGAGWKGGGDHGRRRDSPAQGRWQAGGRACNGDRVHGGNRRNTEHAGTDDTR